MARKSPEQSLISSVVRDGDYQEAVSRGITASQFHIHHEVWTWIEKYNRRNGKSPSEAALRMAFPDFRLLPVNDTLHFSDEVHKSHQRFLVTDIIQEATDLVMEGDIDKAVSILRTRSISAASAMGPATDDGDVITDYKDILGTLEGRWNRVKERGIAGVPTGWQILDHRTGGPQPGQVWVIAARAGEAKTWTMIRMGASAAMAGYRVQFHALEMTRTDVAARLHSFLGKGSGKQVFDSMNLTMGKDYSMVEYKKFLRELRGTVGGQFHVQDAQHGKVSDMTIAAAIERNNPDIVFVDYLTLMANTSGGKSDDWGPVAANIAALSQLSKEYNVPIVVASQLNRGGASKTGDNVGLEHLSRADAVGQDADAVIMLHRMSQGVRKFRMVKNRHGVDGFKWFAEFKPGKGIFDEVSYDRALEIKDEDKDADDE